MIGKSGPTAARIAATTSAAKRARSRKRRAAVAVRRAGWCRPRRTGRSGSRARRGARPRRSRAAGVGRGARRRRRWCRRCPRRSSPRRAACRAPMRPEGLSTGASGSQPAVWLLTEPVCQICGPILPPAACTASITPLPARQRASPWKNGMPRLVARGRPVDHRAFGQDQADPALGAAAVIGRDVLARGCRSARRRASSAP